MKFQDLAQELECLLALCDVYEKRANQIKEKIKALLPDGVYPFSDKRFIQLRTIPHYRLDEKALCESLGITQEKLDEFKKISTSRYLSIRDRAKV